QIFEGLPLGVVVYGKDQKPTYMNRRSAQILTDPETGKTPDITAGRTIAQAIEHFSFKLAGTEQIYPVEQMPVSKALHGEPAFADDIEIRDGNNHRPLEIWANPIKDDQGNVESAVAVFQDITVQKQVDTELAAYRQNLEQIVKERTFELNAVNEQLQLRVKWLLAFNEIRQSITGGADLSQAFEKLLLAIYDILKAKVVFLVRWDEQYQMYCHSAQEHIPPSLEEIEPEFLHGTPLREQIDQGKILILTAEEAASLPTQLGVCFNDINYNSMIISPLMIHQVPGGVLGIASANTREHIGLLQVELIERITYDLAGLVEESSMLDQRRILAALEERNRLARDLHDSVSQTLFTTTLLTEVMPQVWRRDPEQGLQMLDKLRRLTRGALAEMRTMLIELRPSAVLNTPLSELLSQLTEAVTSRSGLPFQLFIEKIDVLPDEVQMNFYRVAQEALNNVVKHSQAMHITVSLSETPFDSQEKSSQKRRVRLVIQDDGVGFASGSEKPGRLGMGIMNERAAAIQADLSIISEPGHGTQVTLTWFGDTANGN
ncbi:MAG: hypothetical protein FIA98_01780, partial [Anaerolineae bacterium]|nr:hypothetical protein [Anaerolineae bacterium]